MVKVINLLLVAISVFTMSFSSLAAQKVYEVKIKNHKFHPSVVKVPANQRFKLKVINEDSVVEEFESIQLNREKIIRPGKSATIKMGPLKKGEYSFFGEFHPETAQGKIVVE